MKQIIKEILSKLEQLGKISTTKLSLLVVLAALLVVWKALEKL